MLTRFAGLALGAMTLVVLSATWSEGQTPTDNLNAVALHRSLRDVINTGADLFNIQGDHAGCYRLYQGSLMAIKPILRPQLQAEVDKALAEAAKEPSLHDRAHRLRVAIDTIRDQIKIAPSIPEPPTIRKTESKVSDRGTIRVLPKKVGG